MELLPPAYEKNSPTVPLESTIGRLALTWYNTRLRDFPHHPDMRHVELLTTQGVLAFPADDELWTALHGLDFPQLRLPYVDLQTNEWRVGLETLDLAELTPQDFGNGE